MSEAIGLQDLIENNELISDLCRFREQLCSEQFIRRKHKLNNATWDRLGGTEGDLLVEKIEAESARRIRDGSAKREAAQKHVVRVPEVAASILNDVGANSRHRLDAGALIDKLAANGPEAAIVDSNRFSIIINLGADVSGKEIIERFDKSIRPLEPGETDPDDISPNHIGTGVIAALTVKKSEDGGGEPL